MVSRVLVWVIAMSGLFVALSAAQADEETLYPVVYHLPASFFREPDPSSKSGFGKLKEWAVPLDVGRGVEALDVRKFLEAQGLVLSPGSEAIFYEDSGALFVRLSKRNIETLESFGPGTSTGPYYYLPQAEITVVSLKLSGARPAGVMPSFSELKKMAADSWTEIARSSVLSKSGMRVVASASSGKEVPVVRPEGIIELPPAASGSALLIEVVIGPDGKMVDATLSFRFRSGEEASARNVAFDGSTTLEDGYPQVLQMTGPMADGLTYAVILQVSLTLPNSWPVQTSER